MRYFALILLLALTSCKKGNIARQEKFVKAKIIPSKIDSLNSEEEVENYIRNLDTNLRDFYLTDYSRIITLGHSSSPYADSLNRIYAKQLRIDKTFYKTDFNNDGLTDLLLIGGWGHENEKSKIQFYQFNSQIVINGGRGKSKTYSLARDYNFAFVPQIVETDSLPILVLHHPRDYDTIYPPHKRDTLQLKLIYKSGYFVELNKNRVKNHEIEKIEFATNFWETAPTFQMILNKDNDSWFIAMFNNFENENNEGTYKTIIDDSDFNKISDLLNYIDFENLREDYSIYHTGPPSMALKITYDNGKVKEIYNNNGAGTYGLETIYNKMLDLRFSEDWKQTDEPKNIRLPLPEKINKWKA